MNESDQNRDNDSGDLQERVVHIRRVAKVVKGGRNLTFNAMVVVGDGKGRVGAGLGKGTAVPDAVRQGTIIAKKNLMRVPIKGSTIPHAVRCNFGASIVLLKPAPAGAGVIAGGAVRAVMEAAGVKDVVAKALGSRNPINVVKATLSGLETIRASLGRRDGLASAGLEVSTDDGTIAAAEVVGSDAPKEEVDIANDASSVGTEASDTSSDVPDSQTSASVQDGTEIEATDETSIADPAASDDLGEGSDVETNN